MKQIQIGSCVEVTIQALSGANPTFVVSCNLSLHPLLMRIRPTSIAGLTVSRSVNKSSIVRSCLARPSPASPLSRFATASPSCFAYTQHRGFYLANRTKASTPSSISPDLFNILSTSIRKSCPEISSLCVAECVFLKVSANALHKSLFA